MSDKAEQTPPAEQRRVLAMSMYQPRRTEDRLTLRRACYGEFALQQEGDGRSVYLSRGDVVRLAVRLLREAARRDGRA